MREVREVRGKTRGCRKSGNEGKRKGKAEESRKGRRLFLGGGIWGGSVWGESVRRQREEGEEGECPSTAILEAL